MAKITKAELLGKSKADVQALVLARFQAGKLSQKEFDAASKYLGKLNSGQKFDDEQMVANLLSELGMS